MASVQLNGPVVMRVFLRDANIDASLPRYIDADNILHIDGVDQSALQAAYAAYDKTVAQREVAFDALRRVRDRLLAETDWVVVKAQEAGEAVPAAWQAYRTALRDLPANTTDPSNPAWPTKPGA
jgi:ribosomal 50S subunit-associated protein YjgA (DUF615 family)